MSLSSHFAKTDTARAIELARANRDAWSACQDFAWAMRFAPLARVDEINQEIERRVLECRDDYQSSAVRAWQVSAFVERGMSTEGAAALKKAMRSVSGTMTNSSRSEALFLLFQAAYPLGPAALGPVARALVGCQEERSHWRVSRNIADALAMLSAMAPDLLAQLRPMIVDETVSRKVEAQIRKGSLQPRDFFW